jgi:hypothetical protein
MFNVRNTLAVGYMRGKVHGIVKFMTFLIFLNLEPLGHMCVALHTGRAACFAA